MKRNLLYLTILLGAIVVFYFSWKGNPDLEESWWMPQWVVVWGNENFNLRTAVPFVGMGLVLALLIPQKLLYYLLCWLLMLALVVIAEAGQLVLPSRNFDTGDIAYGALGAALGLLLGKLLRLFKRS